VLGEAGAAGDRGDGEGGGTLMAGSFHIVADVGGEE